MPTEAKQATVAELREDLANSRTLIVSEYRGLKVKEIAEIRRALRKQDVSYRVVKNRLMRIAAEDSVGEALSPLLVGPTAIAFGPYCAVRARASSSPRPTSGWTPSSAFLRIFLDGLGEGSTVTTPVTVDRLFDTIPPAAANGPSAVSSSARRSAVKPAPTLPA